MEDDLMVARLAYVQALVRVAGLEQVSRERDALPTSRPPGPRGSIAESVDHPLTRPPRRSTSL